MKKKSLDFCFVSSDERNDESCGHEKTSGL